MKGTAVILVLNAVLLNGCYMYVRPAATVSVPMRSTVALTLSTEAQIRLRDRIGIDERELRGQLVYDDGNVYHIEVQSSGPMEGMAGGPLFQRIDLARTDVLEVRVRQISTARSLAMGTAVAGAGAAIIVSSLSGEKNPGSVPGDGTGPDDRVSQLLPKIPIR